VNSIGLQVLLYALVAAASPVALGTTLLVLRSDHGRLGGLAFATGFVAGQLGVIALAYALGAAALPVGDHPHETARGLFELALGVALVLAGAYVSRQPPRPPNPYSRSKAVLARLQRMGLVSILFAGLALGFGGPKRLSISVLAAGTISAADLGDDATIALALAYVVIATVLVWLPVVLAIIFGARAERWMTSVESWLSANRRAITVYPVTILGVLITLDALVALLR
jgi:Sap, sulfolipid-1-addressing protein